MRVFRYQAIDYFGETTRGSIESPSLEAATGELGVKGLYLVSIGEVSGTLVALQRSLLALRVGPADILGFVQGLSVMVTAGMPILGSLDDVIASTPNGAFLPVVRDIRRRLERGSSLSLALEAHGDLFPGILKTLVAVGEETGTLAQSLKEAFEHLARMQKLKDVVKKALLYPVLAAGATLGALIFWLVFVIPSLAGSLKGLGVKLPALTALLIQASALFLAHWQLGLALCSLVALALFGMGKNPRTRYLRDRVLVKTPVVKGILLNRLMVTFSEQFGMLVRGGVNLERLFDLLMPAVGNAYFSAQLLRAKENVLNGSRISDALERQNFLPPEALAKIRTGETTGALDSQLQYLARWYTVKLDNSIDNLGKVIEPLVMIIIGGMFGLIAMGLLLPIYDLVSKLGRT
jgi:type II secretory pathway component PulF